MKKGYMFLAGVLMGAIAFGGAVSYAATGKKSLSADFSNIKLVVGGKLVKSELEPFLYDGRVYVPLRVAAEAMGKEVGWENNIVLIGNQKQSLLLTDLLIPSEAGLTCSKGASITVSGTSYDKGFYINGKDGPTGTLSFFVQGSGIKTMSGLIGVDDSNTQADKIVDLTILNGSKAVWEGKLKKGDNPTPIDIKIDDTTSNVYFKFSNVANMKIDFINFIASY